MTALNTEDRKFLRAIVQNQEFQRVITIVLEEHKTRAVEYMRTCLNRTPPVIEDAIRAAAQAQILEGLLQEVLIPATKEPESSTG